MGQLILPMILVGVLLIFGAVFLIVSASRKSKGNKSSTNQTSTNSKTKSTNENNKSQTEIPRVDVFKFMEFDKIIDGMISQNNGTKFTMAIKCKGINYDLMSDMEQLAVEEGFITFLNTLNFPIQLYVQAQNIDLKGAINTYKQNASSIKEEYDEANKTYTELLDQFDAKPEDIKQAEERRNRVLNVYEYASDIINYVEKLSLNKNLLQRNFYVLVSYYTSELTTTEKFSKEETINICYNELLTRAQSIINALSSCSVSGEVLNSNELADLLYIAYNRDDKGLVGVKEAIESGFYRLYSTSEDVFLKRQEKLEKEIAEIAEIKAVDAIKKAMENGTYISPEAEKLDVLERTNKEAANLVKNEDIPNDIKDKAKQVLVEDYIKDKNKILEQVAQANPNNQAKDAEKDNKNDNAKDKVSKEPEDEDIVLDSRMGLSNEQNSGDTLKENVNTNNSVTKENKSENIEENKTDIGNQDDGLLDDRMGTSNSNNNDDDDLII